MKCRLSLALCVVLCVSSLAAAETGHALTPAPTSAKPGMAADYGKLPLSFEANQGQSESQVRFTSRGSGYSLFLTDRAAVLALTKIDSTASGKLDRIATLGKAVAKSPLSLKTDVVRMELAGASRGIKVEGAEQLPGTANYFIGNDPAKWHTNVPTYGKVKYSGVYPGVDLVYYGNQRQLEYDFVVGPGADPKMVKLHFAGAEKLQLAPDGDLMVVAKNGEIAFHKPVVYQLGASQQVSESASQREMVEGKFVLLAGSTVGFRIGNYDRGRELVIDPTLAYSTYLGGSGSDVAYAVAVDKVGSAYVAGYTLSPNFPITPDADPTKNPDPTNGVAFVTKLNASGSALEYSTYLGGSQGGCYTGLDLEGGLTGDVAFAIAVDSTGHAYVAGRACSTNFPTVNPYQNSNRQPGFGVGFVTKLNTTGTDLLYSTYLGGSNGLDHYDGDWVQGIAVDGSGSAYVTGQAFSTNFPTTMGAYETTTGAASNTGFVTKLSTSGSSLVYSTYLTNNYSTGLYAIAVDSSGDAYVTGYTDRGGYPVTSNAFQPDYPGGPTGYGTTVAVLTELDSSGAAPLYSTYLGGTGTGLGEDGIAGDAANGIAIDHLGNAYVVGYTFSHDFPVKGAFQSRSYAPTGGYTGFVSKIDTSSGDLVYSTYLGGSGGDGVNSVAVDFSGNAYLTGATSSYGAYPDGGFPVTPGAYQATNNGQANGAQNAFFTKLNATGEGLIYSTYLGGSGFASGSSHYGDNAKGIALDSLNNPYLAGLAYSTDFPTLKTSFQPATKATKGNSNAFVSRFVFHTATKTTVTSDPSSPQFGQTLTFTAYVSGKAGSEILPSGTVSFSVDGGTPVVVTLDDTGHAEYSTLTLGVGSHSISATYSGDVNYFSSTGSLSEVVSAASTFTSLTSSPNPSTVNQAVTFTATVTAANGATPAGTVTFKHGGTVIGTGTLSGGVATLVYSGLAAGSHSITATYNGSSTDATSTSTAISQVVNVPLITTTTALTSSPNPSTVNQAVTFTATVTAASGATPAGTVTFKHGGTVIGTGTLSGGVATLVYSGLAVGGHSITAAYGGSSTDATSTSAAISQTVNQ